MDLLFLLWAASLAAYILWAYFLLPELLFEGRCRGLGLRALYFAFLGLTAGLGPVIWYFIRVDPVLRRMANRTPNHRPGVDAGRPRWPV